MSKLGKAEKAARTISAKVPRSQRDKVVRSATRRVSAKASIDFARSVRK